MDNLIIAIAIMAVLCVLRVPIYLSILGAALYLQVFVNHIPLASTVNSIVEGLAKSSLLCIPFFILAGGFLKGSSLGRRLVNLFAVMLRKIEAGFAIAALLSNAFFGAISGSAPAAVATFGQILYSPLEKKYGSKLSLGLLTSSGTLSTIIPPSITLVIYGAATNTSTTKLFMAGLLPGIFIVAVISCYLVVKCRATTPEQNVAVKNEVVAEDMTLGRAFLESLPVLILPVIILGGIYGGFFTPTEAASVAVIYACIAAFALGDIKVKDLPQIFMGACKTSAQIMILIGVSTAFAQAAIVAQIPTIVAAALGGLNKFEFLLVLNLILLIVGCFFEPGAAILILGPLVFPVATALMIDPVHLGIIFTVNLAIGMFTPPFGLNIFVVQGVLKKNMGEVSRAVIPYIILYIVATLVITYVEQLSLLLPNLLM